MRLRKSGDDFSFRCRGSGLQNHMAKLKQTSFFKDPRKNTKRWWVETQYVFGGGLKYKKCKRPFGRNRLVHVVLKAQEWAAFHQRGPGVRQRIEQAAKKCHVLVKDLAINKDHIHIVVTTSHRKLLTNFLRQVSAGLGHFIKAELAKLSIEKTGSLWLARPFTRLVSWAKKPFSILKNYIHRNRQEVQGLLPYRSRKHRLNSWLDNFSNPFSKPFFESSPESYL
jgi:REP element-mobilizing transposase RayT